MHNNAHIHHPRYIAGSSFRPLSKIPHCCPLLKSGHYFNSGVVDHPLRPTKSHRLVKLLPHQLPDSIGAQSVSKLIFIQPLTNPKSSKTLTSKFWNIFSFSTIKCTFSKRLTLMVLASYSPVRHSKPKWACVQLACVRHIASIHSEPESNSTSEVNKYNYPNL